MSDLAVCRREPAHAPIDHAPLPDSDHSAPVDHAANATPFQLPGPPQASAANPVLAQAVALQGTIAAEVAQAKLAKTLQALPIATRLAIDSHDIGADGNRHDFLYTLDAIEDPDVRRQVLQQFSGQTGQSVHDFVAGNSDFAKRDAKAVDQMISPERDQAEREEADMSPEQRADLDHQAAKWAAQLVSTTSKTDANDDENAEATFRTLGPRSAVEMEAIREQVRKRTGGKLTAYEAVDWHMKGANEDEAVQELSGDRVENAKAAIVNADGNPDRLKEVLRELKPDELGKLRQDKYLMMFPAFGAEGDKDEISALIHGEQVSANVAHVRNLLEDPTEGIDMGKGPFLSDQDQKTIAERQPENVLKELESMSPEDLKAAREQHDQKAKEGKWWDGGDHRTFDDMIAERFEDDPVGKLRVQALLSGNRAEDRALKLQQGIDRNNQEEIEGALANPDLALADKPVQPKDVGRLIAAQLEQQQTNIAFMAEDVKDQRTMARLKHADPNAVVGHDVSQALGQHYDEEAKHFEIPSDPFEAARIADDPEAFVKKHQEAVHDERVGADELWSGGQLSMATRMHRARGKDDEKQMGDLAESLESRKDLTDAETDSQKKYGTDLLPTFGKLYSDMNANQKRIYNVRHDGVVGERRPDVEIQDEWDVWNEEFSGGMEARDQMEGGGTQDATAWEIAAHANEVGKSGQLAAGVTRADFNDGSEVVEKGLATQEAEKIKYGEQQAHVFGTIMKVVGMLTADPLLVGLADAAGGFGEIGIKESIEGEAYHATDDLAHVGATLAGDGAFGLVSWMHEASNLAAAEKVAQADQGVERTREALWDSTEAEQVDKRFDEFEKAQREKTELEDAAEKVRSRGDMAAGVAKKVVTTVGDDEIDHKDGKSMGLDLLLGTAGEIVPSMLGGAVEKRLGKPAGLVTEFGAGVTFDPNHDALGKAEEMAGAEYNKSRMKQHNEKLPPEKQRLSSSNAYSWESPEHETDEKKKAE